MEIRIASTVLSSSTERVIELFVQAGSRALQMPVAITSIKSVVERGMVAMKTEDGFRISLPLDTISLCFGQKIFIWARTLVKDEVVFDIEIGWPGLVLAVDRVPSLGASR
jgi:hypothetical protein